MRWAVLPGVLVLAACGFGGRTIAVLGPDGKAMNGAVVLSVRPDSGTYDAWESTGGGVARIPGKAIHDNSRLIVYAPGCRMLDIAMPRKSGEVRLEPGIPVRFVLAEGYDLPPAWLTLEATFETIERPHRLPEEFDFGLVRAVAPAGVLQLEEMDRTGVDCFFDPDSKAADVLFPCPGRWNLRLRIMKYEVKTSPGGRETTGSGTTLHEDADMEITVEDGEDLQTIVLSPDPKIYRRTVERIVREKD
jgi:hypothetical protein